MSVYSKQILHNERHSDEKFNEFLDDISEDVLPNEATGFKESQIWNMLYNFQKDAALAIINKIKEMEPNSEFLYIGTHNRMEKDIIPKYNIPFETIEIYGFNRKNIFKNF